jgi:aspartate carbamoyltransferase catalytic subunit
MAALAGREVKKLPTLRGRTVVNLFYEDSTRTRISSRRPAKRLSADVINFSGQGLQRLEGREPQGHRADPAGDGRRRGGHPAPGLRRAAPAGVLGGRLGDQRRATAPTSTRRRRCWTRTPMRSRLGRLDGLNVAIVGDVLHSRVARSNVLLLPRWAPRSPWSGRRR